MNELLSIETPEQIVIDYQKAGIGSRFYAALLDTLLLGILLFLGAYVNNSFIVYLSGLFGNWLGAIGGIIVFALFWGYYMIFEITTNGQSPGKYLLRLRVIKEGGYPISATDSAIRNLVRLADFMPFFYGTGLLVMLFSKHWQRLGDLAAGTLVIKTAPKNKQFTEQTIQPVNILQKDFLYSNWIQPKLVTDSDLEMIREYLSRRSTLSIPRRNELAKTIGTPLVLKMGGSDDVRYDRFLKELYVLKIKESS